jgi:hypothetical protein
VIEAFQILKTLDKRMGRFLFNLKLLYLENLWFLEMLTIQNHLNSPNTPPQNGATFMPSGKIFGKQAKRITKKELIL